MLERLIGGGVGSRIINRDDSQRKYGEEIDKSKSMNRNIELNKRKRKIEEFTSSFHISADTVLDDMVNNYNQIYGDRKNGKGFRKNELKDRSAIAFSMCNVLNTHKIPRPHGFIASVCGVSTQSMLNVTKVLNLTSEDTKNIKQKYHKLAYAPPQDYVHTLCAYLSIPFQLANFIHDKVKELEWKLYGHYPEVIIAAVTCSVLEKCGEPYPPNLPDKIFEALDCIPSTVKKVMKKIPDYYIPTGAIRFKKNKIGE